MKKQKKNSHIKNFVIALLFVLLIGIATSASLNVTPITQQVALGDEFDINLTANSVVDLYSYQFDLSYDSNVIELVEVFNGFSNVKVLTGPFLGSDGQGVFDLQPVSTPGLLDNYAATRYGTSSGVSGSGVIAKIRFKAIAVGNSNLQAFNDSFFDSNETVPQSISHTTAGGAVTIINCDVDGDTYRSLSCGGTDCNDGNASINPGATEACNGVDDNCIGGIDEGVQTTFYSDVDMDRYSNGTTSTQCVRPLGFNLSTELLATSGDCNDGNALEFPGQIWFRDGDMDRYSNGTTLTQCSRPLGFNVTSELIATSGDCNDGDALINPGATEICDGVDNNCIGGIDDSFTNETCSYVCSTSGFDFNISRQFPLTCCGNNLFEANPFQPTETSCSDGNDNDCNGEPDMADLSCILSSYDLNLDGNVSIADIQLAAQVFGLSNCAVINNWCDRKDVTRNGMINIQDLSAIGLHFT